MGFVSIVFMTASTAIVQVRADPAMRGRVLALQAIVFLGSTPSAGRSSAPSARSSGPAPAWWSAAWPAWPRPAWAAMAGRRSLASDWSRTTRARRRGARAGSAPLSRPSWWLGRPIPAGKQPAVPSHRDRAPGDRGVATARPLGQGPPWTGASSGGRAGSSPTCSWRSAW